MPSPQLQSRSPDDEITPIISNQHGPAADYQSGAVSLTSRSQGQASNDSRERKIAARGNPTSGTQQDSQRRLREEPEEEDDTEEDADQPGFFRRLVDKYGAVELDNKGSVARDHLALGTHLTSQSPLQPIPFQTYLN